MLRAEYMLAKAYVKNKSYLLAASTYKRVLDDFPGDSIAPHALLGMADADALAWRGPDWDSQHAELALDAYSLLQRLYPASPLVKQATGRAGEDGGGPGAEGAEYRRNSTSRRGVPMYDSALIYLRAAAQKYPGTAASREAMIKMVEVYRRLKYLDDAGDVCKTLRSAYGTDSTVVKTCAGIRADTTR